MKEGDTVILTAYPEGENEAKVLDVLASQFTCEDKAGRTLFFFKQDKGDTWKMKKDQTSS